MVAMPQIGRKLTYKRREKWFLQRAVQRAVQPQTAQMITGPTPADILAQWDTEGMGDSWASRQDIGELTSLRDDGNAHTARHAARFRNGFAVR